MHERTFDYAMPTPMQIEQMESVREAARIFCDVLAVRVPDGPDKTHAIRLLRTVGMWANVAITRQPDGAPRT